MKIERPILFDANKSLGSDLVNDVMNSWFIRHVEPINKLLSEGVELYSSGNVGDRKEAAHVVTYDPLDKSTHKAILINIEKIKQDTAEDILRDFVEYEDSIPDAMKPEYEKIFDRAKKILGVNNAK